SLDLWSSIKAVTLDFGGTLARGRLDTRGYRDRLLHYLRGLGYEIDEVSLRRAIERMLRRMEKARNRDLELRFEELYSGVLHTLGIRADEELLDDIYRIYLKSYSFELFRGAEEVLENLDERYRLAIISNAISDLPRYALKESGLDRFFQVIVLSKDIGIRKPDLRIFRYTLERLGVKPEKALHVGDSARHDVAGAKRLGMKAIWIISEEEQTIEADHVIASIDELKEILREI
ncbi:MAG: HAD family hydrolase, partial [Candidatus Geothermarchaeales archaeon]